MAGPGFWAAFWAAAKALKDKLLKPNDPKPLDDHSQRNINVFSKVEEHNTNVIVINNPETGENFAANLDEIPPEVMDKIRKSFDRKVAKMESLPRIRLIRNEFQHDMLDYEEHVSKKDTLLDEILPHLNPEYASILKLSSYAKKKFEQGRIQEGQKIKEDIGEQYGSNGRRLCNLYIKGYIDDMLDNYIGILYESAQDKEKIGVHLNTLIRKIILYSEYVFFIHGYTNIEEVTDKIRYGMAQEVSYIALHAAGSKSIKRTEDILKAISPDNFEKCGYDIKNVNSPSTAVVAIFDVFISLKSVKYPALYLEDDEDY